MVAWSLKCISKLHFFINFKNFDKIYGSSSPNNFYIIRKLISGSRTNFQHIYNFNHFIDFQRSMETKNFG